MSSADNGAAVGGGAATLPGAPTLRSSARGSQSIVIGWDPPSADGGASIVGHELQTSAASTTGWTSLPELLPAGRGWFVDSGLRPGTTRYYRLRSVSTAGPGPWSTVLEDTTLVIDGPIMTATASGTGRIDLSWKAPAPSTVSRAYPGPRIMGYELQVSDTGSTDWRRLGATLGHGARTYSHTGLPGGTRKYYRIRAVAEGMAAGWSNVVSAVVAPVASPA